MPYHFIHRFLFILYDTIHLLCELSVKALDLYWFEGGMSAFWFTRLLVSKMVWEIGKTAVSIINRRNKRSFHRPIPHYPTSFPLFLSVQIKFFFR